MLDPGAATAYVLVSDVNVGRAPAMCALRHRTRGQWCLVGVLRCRRGRGPSVRGPVAIGRIVSRAVLVARASRVHVVPGPRLRRAGAVRGLRTKGEAGRPSSQLYGRPWMASLSRTEAPRGSRSDRGAAESAAPGHARLVEVHHTISVPVVPDVGIVSQHAKC